MSLPTLPPKKKLPLAKLALAGVAMLVVAAIVVYFVGWRTVWEEGRALFVAVGNWVSGAGPAVYFSAMALLPVVGVPMAPFALAAGPLFGDRLGMAGIMLLGVAALTFNLTVTYWLARRGVRPLLTRLLGRFGYAIPHVGPDEITDLIVLLRVTPGIPFAVQNYLLGLCDAPFVRYLVISCAIQWPINCGFMFFGDALGKGKGKVILTAVLLIVALSVGTRLVRKHLAKKKASA